MKKHSIDIVIPVYNELKNINKIISSIAVDVAPSFSKTKIIFVDDGSTDGTVELFKNMKSINSLSISYIKFSQNFKKDIAVKCGLDHSTANYCAVIDGDLQQPPIMIVNAYQKALEGYNIVHICKTDYKTSLLRKAGSKTFAFLIEKLAGFKIRLTDFKLMSSAVVKEFQYRTEKSLFFAGLVEKLGFSTATITYKVRAREHGYSSFSLIRLLKLAIKSIVSISVKPLRFASILGLLLSVISFTFTIWLILERLITRNPIPGFATLAGGLFLLGGLQLLFLGIIGEYIGQIYTEIKGGKQYIIEEEIHIEENNNKRR